MLDLIGAWPGLVTVLSARPAVRVPYPVKERTITLLGTTNVVVGGVDTHADTHTLAALDQQGRLLGTASVPATRRGSAQALAWLRSHGELSVVGVEGTGSYGAQLARHLADAGVAVVEVDRPDRKSRRAHGESDPLDAQAAARAVLAGTARTTPKARSGAVECLRALKASKRSAMKAMVAARSSLRQQVITAPAALREQLDPLTGPQLVIACAALRPDRARLHEPTQGVKLALRRTAQRCQHLAAEIAETDADIAALVVRTAPALLEHYGVGPDTAAQLLITAGDNPERIQSDAAFAALCGASPIPASSGRTDRHRLNRGGDRKANEALWRIIMVRLSHDTPSRAYAQRRKATGLTSRETIRCLKRYLVRELLPTLKTALQPPEALDAA